MCKTQLVTAPPKLLLSLSLSLSPSLPLSMASLSYICMIVIPSCFRILSSVAAVTWKYLYFAFALYKKIYNGKSKLIQK